MCILFKNVSQACKMLKKISNTSDDEERNRLSNAVTSAPPEASNSNNSDIKSDTRGLCPNRSKNRDEISSHSSEANASEGDRENAAKQLETVMDRYRLWTGMFVGLWTWLTVSG